MNIKEKLKEVLIKTLPFLRNLFEEKIKITSLEEICEKANKNTPHRSPDKEAKKFAWYILPLKKGFKFNFTWRF